MVNGVDLRRGQFKTAATDEDLVRVLATGAPAAGMPAFPGLQSSEVTGIIAFIRSGFDAAAGGVIVGDAARGRTLFAGKGGCKPVIASMGGPRVANRSRNRAIRKRFAEA